jgi:hypothetical protein
MERIGVRPAIRRPMDRLKLVPSMPTPPETDPGLDAALRYQFTALSVLAPQWGQELGTYRSKLSIEDQTLFFDLAMRLLKQFKPEERREFDDEGCCFDGKPLSELRSLLISLILPRHSVMGIDTKRVSEAFNRFNPPKDAEEQRYLAGWCFVQRLVALLHYAIKLEDKAQTESLRRRKLIRVVR